LPESGALVALPNNEAIAFRFPDKRDGYYNNVVCDGQRIVMPEPRAGCDAAWFLGACHNGGQSALLTLEYEKGEAFAELRLADWCAQPAAGERDVLRMPARHTAEGKEEQVGCGLVAWAIPLDPARKLVAIRLPRERQMHLFALTLSRSRCKEQ
jgi:hypothetical protein